MCTGRSSWGKAFRQVQNILGSLNAASCGYNGVWITPLVRILEDNGEKRIHLCNIVRAEPTEVRKETLTGFDQVAGVIGIWDLAILGN